MTITLTLADIKEMISRRYKQLDVWSTQNFYDLQAKEIDELRDLLDKMTKGRVLSACVHCRYATRKTLLHFRRRRLRLRQRLNVLCVTLRNISRQPVAF